MPKPAVDNTLYYGDNYDVLKRYIKDESVDLIYLDPPFKSNQDYNVLFAEQSGARSAAQIKAFEDTWQWDQNAALSFQHVVEGGGKVAQAMLAFRQFLGETDMLAYLAMMAPRLVELKRILKQNGSLFLHCDPTASHYLKMLLDAVFGALNFRNEIIWQRTSAHANVIQKYGAVHDVLLFYTVSDEFTWNQQYSPYSEEYINTFFDQVDSTGRRYARRDLTAAMARASKGQIYEWKGVTPPPSRCWAMTKEKMDELERKGRVHWPKKEGGMPRLKLYPEDLPGVPLQDIWTDIKTMHNLSTERLGYPTQKPKALLERIIKSSTNEGDVVLDPFCGCGTAIAASQKLNRRWIGIDITHLAITLIKHRLHSAFGKKVHYQVLGEPTDLAGAQELAAQDAYQFQWWALGLVGARPAEQKKGADQGIDGRLYFFDEHLDSGKTKQIIFSVKAGHTGPNHLRDLWGVVEREKAQIGVLITLEEPTKAMRTEAAKAGFYERPFGGKDEHYPRLQILTIAELLEGKTVAYPHVRADLTFRKAPKVEEESAISVRLPFEE
jgi:DNA modification methylase